MVLAVAPVFAQAAPIVTSRSNIKRPSVAVALPDLDANANARTIKPNGCPKGTKLPGKTANKSGSKAGPSAMDDANSCPGTDMGASTTR